MRPWARGRDRRRRGSAAHHWAGGAGPEVRAACRLWCVDVTQISNGHLARLGTAAKCAAVDGLRLGAST
jgi:hypothetical protein